MDFITLFHYYIVNTLMDPGRLHQRFHSEEEAEEKEEEKREEE